VGLEVVPADSLPPFELLSPELAFSFASAEAPPEALDSLELGLPEDSSLLSPFPLSPPEGAEEELSPVVLVVLVDVVEVEVV